MQCSGANQKRKRNVLTIEQKIEILNQFERSTSVAELAKIYNIGQQTVRDIVKKKAALHSFVAKADSAQGIADRKTLKGSTFRELDDAMSKWFLQKRAEGVPISGPMCAKQANKFHEQLKMEGNFSAYSGWLYRFKKRHGIRELAVQGENVAAIVEFCYDLENIIMEHDLRPEQVYNADETVLYWKAMPRTTLAAGVETSDPGFKISKDRITVLCCANASGTHKLRLAVVGKSRNPRSLKNVENLPVDYYNQKAACMDRVIFKKWFYVQFMLQVQTYLHENNLPPKAVLLLDNAPAHPDAEELKSEDGGIFVTYFPPNVTSMAQPMEQGVVETMKRLYKKDLMLQLLGEDDFMGSWKSLDVKEAIYAATRAWNEVTETIIKNAFYKIMTLEDIKVDDNSDVNDDVDELSIEKSTDSEIYGLEDIVKVEIKEWVECDDEEKGYEMINDYDNQTCIKISDKSSDEDENDCVVKRSHQEARDAVNVLMEYFDQQPESDGTEQLQLRKMKEFISVRMMIKTEKNY